MARAHLRHTVRDRAGNVVQNAKCFVYLTGTATAVSDLYAASSGGSPVTFLTSTSQGEIEGWLTTPKPVDIKVTDNGDTAYYPSAPSSLLSWSEFTETVEVASPNVSRFNVLDYGAVGDGATNDAAAIQAAIDAAEAMTGAAIGDSDSGVAGVVEIPAGTYLINSQLTVPAEVRIVGSGRWLTTLLVGADVIGLRLGGNGRNSAESLTVLANVATTKAGIQVGDGTNAIADWHLRDIYVSRSSGSNKFDTGIKTVGAQSGVIDNCASDYPASYAIDLTSVGAFVPNAIRIVNSHLRNGGTANLRCTGSDGGVVLASTTVEGTSPIGALFVDCEDIAVIGSYFENGAVAISLQNVDGGVVVGGKFTTDLTKTLVLDANCSNIDTYGVRFAGTVAHLDSATSSAVTIHGGLLDSSICTGLNNQRTARFGVQDSSAGGNSRIVSMVGGGTTAQRPTAAAAGEGGLYFDTTIDRLISSSGSAWTDPTETPSPLAASAFAVSAGSPAQATLASGRWNAYLFDAAADETVVSAVSFPSNLNGRTVNVKFEWSNNGAGSGDVVWNCLVLPTTDGATLSPATTTLAATVTAGAQDTRKSSLIGSFVVDSSKLYSVRASRTGSDAADTLGNDAALLLVRFEVS